MSDFFRDFFTPKPDPVIPKISNEEYEKALGICLTYECENGIEKWRGIKELDFNYEASNLGNIRSLFLRYPQCLRPIKKGSHLYVNIVNDGKRMQPRLDYLIASTFLKNRSNSNRVIHKDGNNENCIITNLTWG